MRADNDWISQQVAQYAANLRNGLKLHFGNSVVDYHNAEHIAQVARVFRAAMPIVVQTW